MCPAPKRPGDDVCGLDAALGQAGGNASEFLDRPADEVWRAWIRGARVWGVRVLGRRGGVFCGAGWFARWRMLAIMANASMTRLTCRCQPCQERVSLWSRPSSVLAVLTIRFPRTLPHAFREGCCGRLEAWPGMGHTDVGMARPRAGPRQKNCAGRWPRMEAWWKRARTTSGLERSGGITHLALRPSRNLGLSGFGSDGHPCCSGGVAAGTVPSQAGAGKARSEQASDTGSGTLLTATSRPSLMLPCVVVVTTSVKVNKPLVTAGAVALLPRPTPLSSIQLDKQRDPLTPKSHVSSAQSAAIHGWSQVE